MFGNSLVGVTLLVGESIALNHVLGQNYNLTTGKPVRTWVAYPTFARIRGLTDSDSKRLGSSLVKATTKVATIPADQLAAGVRPDVRDQIVTGTNTYWEIFSVKERREHGITIEYELQIGSTGQIFPPSFAPTSAEFQANDARVQGDDFSGGNPPLPSYATTAAFDAVYSIEPFGNGSGREAYDSFTAFNVDGVDHFLDQSVKVNGHQTLNMQWGWATGTGSFSTDSTSPGETLFEGAGWVTVLTDDASPTEHGYVTTRQWSRQRFKADAGIMNDATPLSDFGGGNLTDWSQVPFFGLTFIQFDPNGNAFFALINRGGNIYFDWETGLDADGIFVCPETQLIGTADFRDLLCLYDARGPNSVRMTVWIATAGGLSGTSPIFDTTIPSSADNSVGTTTLHFAETGIEYFTNSYFDPTFHSAYKHLWVADWETMPFSLDGNPYGVSGVPA